MAHSQVFRTLSSSKGRLSYCYTIEILEYFYFDDNKKPSIREKNAIMYFNTEIKDTAAIMMGIMIEFCMKYYLESKNQYRVNMYEPNNPNAVYSILIKSNANEQETLNYRLEKKRYLINNKYESKKNLH